MKNFITLMALCIVSLCVSACSSTSLSGYRGRPYDDEQNVDTGRTPAQEREHQLEGALYEAEERIEELELELFEAQDRIVDLEAQVERANYNVLPEDARYIGDFLTYQFHRLDCDELTSESYCTYYLTEDEALNDGMSPCPVCEP